VTCNQVGRYAVRVQAEGTSATLSSTWTAYVWVEVK
jgi:hypothetical protein